MCLQGPLIATKQSNTYFGKILNIVVVHPEFHQIDEAANHFWLLDLDWKRTKKLLESTETVLMLA